MSDLIKEIMLIYPEPKILIRNFHDEIDASQKYDAFIQSTENHLQNLHTQTASQIKNFIEAVITPLFIDSDKIFKEARCYENIIDEEIVFNTTADYLSKMKIVHDITAEVEKKIDLFFFQLIEEEIDDYLSSFYATDLLN